MPEIPECITVSVVEDNPSLMAIYTGWLEKEDGFRLVGQHVNGLEAVADVPAENPDVVLMDINLPGVDGVECVRQLKLKLPNAQFLMITIHEDSERIFTALAAGATGYLLKDTPRAEVLSALRDVLQGGSPMSSGIARKVVRCFQEKPQVAEDAELASLSAREEEVLGLLARGFLCKEISDALSISHSTVNTYLRRIYEKLHVHSRAQATARYASLKTSHRLVPGKR